MKPQNLMYGPQIFCKGQEQQNSVPLLRRRASLRVGNAWCGLDRGSVCMPRTLKSLLTSKL